MKRLRIAFALALVLGFTACGGGGSSGQPPPAIQNTWDNITWDQGTWA